MARSTKFEAAHPVLAEIALAAACRIAKKDAIAIRALTVKKIGLRKALKTLKMVAKYEGMTENEWNRAEILFGLRPSALKASMIKN